MDNTSTGSVSNAEAETEPGRDTEKATTAAATSELGERTGGLQNRGNNQKENDASQATLRNTLLLRNHRHSELYQTS